jgi:2-hydroxychromene-2-carboxylate isomerase
MAGAPQELSEHPAAGRVLFWYEFASTYAYIAALTIERAAAAAGIVVTWRPFLLGPIFARQGWKDSPFNLYPAKGRYMWRDLERLCAREGLPWHRPERFPQNGLLAARVALVGLREGWGVAFSKAVFRANFAEGRDIASGETVGEILRDLELDDVAILQLARSDAIKEMLRATTDEAERCGVFGAPTFQVGDELFWGSDRMPQALEWAKNPRLGPFESP